MARFLRERIKGRGVRCVVRDIAANPPRMVDRDFVIAANMNEGLRTAAQNARLKESDELVNEVLKSDVIVIGCPLAGDQIPMPLKVWMDNLVRPGKTFTKPDNPLHDHTYGLLHDKLVVLLESQSVENRFKCSNSVLTDAQLRSTLTKLGVRYFDRVTVKENNNPLIGSCDCVSWINCENNLSDLADRLKKRWAAQVLAA